MKINICKGGGIQLLTVGRCGPSPRIVFCGPWLTESGFVPGALVQALPEPGGMVFNLFDDNIISYSGLFNATKEMGGHLLHVSLPDRKNYREPTFSTRGQYLSRCGLSPGDMLIAKYGFGVIRVRKTDLRKPGFDDVAIVTTTSIRRGGALIPQVRLSGGWLSGAGFTIHSVATAAAAPGVITLTLQETGACGYSALMKYVRGNGMKIVQAAKEHHNRGDTPTPCIVMTGSLLDTAGFCRGDMLAAAYGYGVIKLQKPDVDKLGF